jgi:TRAP-type C4-dicarboxylate transport system permease small subunit
MTMKTSIERLERIATAISNIFNWVAGLGLTAMVALAVADIIGIKFFKSPIKGGIEIVAFLGIVVTAFAMAFTYAAKGHIRIDFVTMRLNRRTQNIINAITALLGAVLFIILSWQSCVFAGVLINTGEVSMTQGIPFYPFVYAIALCCVPLVLLLIAEFVLSIFKAMEK